MIIALLADVHANLEALEACLDHAREHGAEQYAFLGDLVGYNADPAAVVDRVSQFAAAGAIVVQGNHDAAVSGASCEQMNESAAAVIRWTRQQLSSAQKSFLAGLPISKRDGPAYFVHASADRSEPWAYVFDGLRAAASMSAAQAPYVFCGHIHEPVLYFLGADRRPQPFFPEPGVPIPVAGHRNWLAIVGSCGQPRGGNPAACYALFDQNRELLTYYRLPYDVDAAARKLRLAGLPEHLARRLETGE